MPGSQFRQAAWKFHMRRKDHLHRKRRSFPASYEQGRHAALARSLSRTCNVFLTKMDGSRRQRTTRAACLNCLHRQRTTRAACLNWHVAGTNHAKYFKNVLDGLRGACYINEVEKQAEPRSHPGAIGRPGVHRYVLIRYSMTRWLCAAWSFFL